MHLLGTSESLSPGEGFKVLLLLIRALAYTVEKRGEAEVKH